MRAENKEGATRKKLMLVGNPNVGKSVIFRRLTRLYAIVSNYPGTTVEIFRGEMPLAGVEYEVIDTPGVNSLVPQSKDEQVTCEMLLKEKPDIVVQVADAKNLRRTLLLTSELADLRIPMILVLNMVDEMQARGIEIDTCGLADMLQIPVVETVATYGHGMRQLQQSLVNAAVPRKTSENGRCLAEVRNSLADTPDVPVELAIEWFEMGDAGFAREVEHLMGPSRSRRVQAALQCHRLSCHRPLCKEIQQRRDQFLSQTVSSMKKNHHLPKQESRGVKFQILHLLLFVGLGLLIWSEIGGLLGLSTPDSHAKTWILRLIPDHQSWAQGLVLSELLHLLLVIGPLIISLGLLMQRQDFAERLGRLTRQPSTGIPILIVVLLLVYEFVGYTGAQTLVGLLEDGLFGAQLVPWLQTLLPTGFFYDLFVGKYGLVSMGLSYSLAIVLPVVGTFFIAFGLLEDSGYLPRLAILTDRVLRKIGLNGKAILPMVLGLGCDTMATITTRILDSPKERLIATLLLALGIPCSAQLGVILGMASGFSPGVTVAVLLIVASQLLLVGYLAAKLIRGRRSDFIFEIPPIRVPILRNVALKTGYRMKWFLWEVLPLFLIATFTLFVLDKVKINERSGIEWMERGLRPVVVGMLDLPQETAQAFVMGFLRRDYGAAGLFDLARRGRLTPEQAIVSLTVITLFIPCLANFLVMLHEQGWKRSLSMVAFIIPFAFAVGTIVNWGLKIFQGIS